MGSSEEVQEDSSHRPKLGQRKSFTDLLSKFATNRFSRRHTATVLSKPNSPDVSKYRSRLPTPSAPSGSSSFFGTFISRSTNSEENPREKPNSIKPRKIFSRKPSPSPEFNKDEAPPITTPTRRHSTLITHRSLMAPLNPPQPRTSIGGPGASIGQPHTSTGEPRTSISRPRTGIPGPRTSISGPHVNVGRNLAEPDTPSFMRSTSSSAARNVGRIGPRCSLPVNVKARVTPPRSQEHLIHNFSRPFTKNNSAVVPREIDSAAKQIADDTKSSIHSKISKSDEVPREIDSAAKQIDDGTKSSIHSEKSESDEIDTDLFESLVIYPSQIPVDEEANSETGTTGPIKEAEDAPEVQANTEVEPDKEDKSVPEARVEAEVESVEGLESVPKAQAIMEVEPAFPERTSSKQPSAGQVNESQHSVWWLGRFTSLSDRLLTEALNVERKTSSLIPGVEPAMMRDDEHRARAVFTHLRNLCATPEAEESLDQFGNIWLRRTNVNEMDFRKKRSVLDIVLGRKKREASK